MPLEPTATLEVADRFLEASRRGDTKAMVAFYAPEGAVWHNYDDTVIDPAASARALAWLHRTVPDLVWDDVRIVATDEGFVLRSVLRGTAKGGPVEIHSCVVVTLDADARILRTDEYLDSAALAPMLSR